jgi:membrane protease YdiL (CAAX protease family)
MAKETDSRDNNSTATTQLIRFFLLAFGGAWLAWLPIVLGMEGLSVLPVRVPLALLFVGTFTGPMLAAFVVSDRTERRDLIARIFRIRMAPWNYVAALLLAPVSVFAVTVAFAEERIPVSHWSLYAIGFIPMLVLGSIAGPWGEEPGWRGFALPRLVLRFGSMRASLLLGVIWAAWHFPIAFFVPAYRGGVPISMFLPAFVVTVCALSVFMTWLYYSSGCSVLATIMGHAAWNAAVGVQHTLIVFPDRRISLISAAVLLAIIALVASHRLSPRHSSA